MSTASRLRACMSIMRRIGWAVLESEPLTQVNKVETIFPAIEKANEKYGPPGDDGSVDKEPVDPGVKNPIDTVEALSNGYLPPPREPSPVSKYQPTKEEEKKGQEEEEIKKQKQYTEEKRKESH